MLCFRITSPLGWIGALVLFFLPWVDISCQAKDSPKHMHVTVSGAQLAWGGSAYAEEGAPSKYFLIDLGKLVRDWQSMLVGLLLNMYLVGLTLGIALALVSSPGLLRAYLGLGIAIVLLILLPTACWVVMGNPLRPPPTSLWFGEWLYEPTLTVWYFASYAANVLSFVTFSVECWYSRVVRRNADLRPAIMILNKNSATDDLA